MVEQSTLLQIIQFVGLITPALAILIELLVGFHGGLDSLTAQRELPVEIQILFIGFSALLFGGMIIGLQFGLTLENQLTQIATLLIFGSLPFLALTVLVMNVRVSGRVDSDASLANRTILSLRYVSSIITPLMLSVALYFYPIIYFHREINSSLSWWIFNDLVTPSLYFYSVAGILTYKLMYSLWNHDIIPSNDYGKVTGQWFVVSLTIMVFYIAIVGIVFAVFYVLVMFEVPFMTPTSFFSAIPYIWSTLMILVLLFTEITPNES